MKLLIIKTLMVGLLFSVVFKVGAVSEELIKSSIDNTQRSESDLIKDKHRKPQEILQFFNISSETTVLDVLAGSGYYSEILSRIVGQKGKVIIHNDAHFLKYYGKELSERLGSGDRLANTTRIDISLNSLELKENSVDSILLVLGYHDFYYVMSNSEKIDVKRVLAKFRKFLKPDGIVGIIDHEALSGAPRNTGNRLHRTDPKIVKNEMMEAGFTFDGELNILKSSIDDKSQKIWDIPNGKTSRFVYRFRNKK
jgi:predicted methyltransferase